MEIREISPEESSLVNQLVSSAFQYQPPHAFLDDFPVWASDQSIRLGLFDQGRLLSHVGIRFTEMRVDETSVPVALIGAVATDEKSRGKGYSTTLLKASLKKIDERGTQWSFLWGSEHDFYAKLGFELKGLQARALLSDLSNQASSATSTEVTEGLTEAIFQSLTTPKNGVPVKEKDRDWVFKHKTVKWYSLKQPFAYLAYERGMDLKNIVHETGGDAEGIKKLFHFLQIQNPEAEIISTPEVLLNLGFQEDQILIESLCLARPLNPTLEFDERFWISGIAAC